MSAHAKLSPSAASRWLVCTASVALAAGYPRQATPFAAEGTFYHSIVADGIEFGLEPSSFLGLVRWIDGYAVECDDEMVANAEDAIDSTRERFPDNLFIETKVDLGNWMPGQFGTLDVGAWDDEFIYIHDEKYGVGVPVSPVDNAQLKTYALGFWHGHARHHTKATNFVLSINQPRCSGGGGVWLTNLEDLLEFGEDIRAKSRQIEAGDVQFVPGSKQCQFCPGKDGSCAAFVGFNLELMSMEFEDLDVESPPTLPILMTPERRSYIIHNAPMIKQWLNTLHDAALSDAVGGVNPVPGFKAVYGNAGHRKWIDKDKAAQLLGEITQKPIFETKLVSPSVAEKLVGKKAFFQSIAPTAVTRSDPKPILVPEADARHAIKSTADEFEDLDAA